MSKIELTVILFFLFLASWFFIFDTPKRTVINNEEEYQRQQHEADIREFNRRNGIYDDFTN